MARDTNEHSVSDEKHPFERFRETVKTLLQVPKEDVYEAVRVHQEERKQDKRREPS